MLTADNAPCKKGRNFRDIFQDDFLDELFRRTDASPSAGPASFEHKSDTQYAASAAGPDGEGGMTGEGGSLYATVESQLPASIADVIPDPKDTGEFSAAVAPIAV